MRTCCHCPLAGKPVRALLRQSTNGSHSRHPASRGISASMHVRPISNAADSNMVFCALDASAVMPSTSWRSAECNTDCVAEGEA